MNNLPKRPHSKKGGNPKDVPVDTIERRLIPRDFPSPDVIEGSESADWALWEEAMAHQGGPKSTPSPKDDDHIADPFASVRKQRGAS